MRDKRSFLFFGILSIALYFLSLHNYLLFHSGIELFAVVVACGIFMISWNSRDHIGNNYLLFLGIAYLFVAILDLFHTLTYKGMGVFLGFDANLTTELWVAARYLETISIFLAIYFLKKNFNVKKTFLTYAIVTSFLLGSIFLWDLFPDCFVEGKGLTQFKIVSEYIFVSILGYTLFLLHKNKEMFTKKVFNLIQLSLGTTILSELSFTLFTDLYGFFNFTGHMFKLISFYYLYEAIIATALKKPYGLLFKKLKESEESLREINSTLEQKVRERTLILNETNVKLEREKKKAEFYLDLLSHDIGNHIQGVLIYLQLASKKSSSNDIIDQYIKTARSQSFEITKMVSNVHKLKHIKETFEIKKTDVFQILNEAIENVKDMNIQKSIDIQHNISPSSVYVLGNDSLQIVFENILQNAIKYDSHNDVLICISHNDEDDFWRFEFKDQGHGISDEMKEQLFFDIAKLNDKFQRFGLGFLVVRQIVTHLHGKVWVEDRIKGNYKKGANVVVALPKIA